MSNRQLVVLIYALLAIIATMIIGQQITLHAMAVRPPISFPAIPRTTPTTP